MPRHHIDAKLPLVALLMTALLLTPSLAVPSIWVSVQSIGASQCEKFWIDVNVTNLENRELVNYTFNITMPSEGIVAYSRLKLSNVYVVDENGKPLYYWVMRKSSSVFTVFFKVPHIAPNGRATVRIYYGSDNPYRRYRKPAELFVYWESFNSLKNYPHVDSGIFSSSGAFGSGERYIKKGKLVVNSTISTDWWSGSTAKEAELVRLKVDDSYAVVFKFKRGSGKQGVVSYPFYMFIHADVGNGDRYDYIAIKENSNSKFRFEFGNDRSGSDETNKYAGKQYYLGEILVTPRNSTGRIEKFSSGALVASYTFETSNRFRNREISIGFGQANADWWSTVNLLAYIDWVCVVRYSRYTAEIAGMGAECGFN
ncbi:DUF2341 domain-containing protein [Thermococcus indicus]|uniref:DUF2341 domain-containing protein n=1 Tax=Thermococcus indicus TaxID=2586643 RepID=A0A4Y5SHY8_9EURY|nr:DUF2341 domain-containing protein [Thermococcus indicus]QDA30358.1 DUF2341 domain-containing protein [Thermococcus indicus]